MKISTILTALLCISPIIMAKDHGHDDHDHHDHKAHTHGEAEMAIIFDNNLLMLELESPAANIFGFEHEPQNKSQWKKVEEIRNTITGHPEKLFTVPEHCSIDTIDIDIPFNQHKENHNKDHDDHEDHDKHDHNDHDREQSESHEDIHIAYAWNCKDNINLIEVKLFDQFTGFEKISVQWIVNSKQGFKTLTSDNTTLSFK